MPLDKKIAEKASGDPIASADWNTLATETIRLDTAKLNTTGGTVAGLLTAAAGLASPTLRSDSLGITLLTPDNDVWNHKTDTSAGRAVISRSVEFAVPTTVFLVGHGHASTDAGTSAAKRAVHADIRMDGALLNPVRESTWGSIFLNLPTGTWATMVTLASANVPKGKHTFELWLRAIDSAASGADKYAVSLHGPSLWLARLGTF
ncbi:hypothetical protein [Catenuloplanes japonicus]|uniref:hypothetical protein n=1 Tax=Catenuloplanes japonicus TaxID=33876 RepID=UPI0005241A79|nr:hypothetical protein [Catenuloplanes japonicus]